MTPQPPGAQPSLRPKTENLTLAKPTGTRAGYLQARFENMPKLILLSLLTLYLTVLLPHTHFKIGNGNAVLGLNSLENREIDAVLSGGCSNKIGECFEEPEMESEISRRVLLMQKKYISYETLKRDMVPCTKPGASYYDCTARAAHPYSRGCEVITRCARDIEDIKT